MSVFSDFGSHKYQSLDFRESWFSGGREQVLGARNSYVYRNSHVYRKLLFTWEIIIYIERSQDIIIYRWARSCSAPEMGVRTAPPPCCRVGVVCVQVRLLFTQQIIITWDISLFGQTSILLLLRVQRRLLFTQPIILHGTLVYIGNYYYMGHNYCVNNNLLTQEIIIAWDISLFGIGLFGISLFGIGIAAGRALIRFQHVVNEFCLLQFGLAQFTYFVWISARGEQYLLNTERNRTRPNMYPPLPHMT